MGTIERRYFVTVGLSVSVRSIAGSSLSFARIDPRAADERRSGVQIMDRTYGLINVNAAGASSPEIPQPSKAGSDLPYRHLSARGSRA